MLNTPKQVTDKICSGRLKKRPEFLAVHATGQKWVSDSVIVQYQPSLDDNFKFGVTATKRVGNAIIRNKCKRRLRSAMNDISKEVDLKPSNIVLIARHSTAICDWEKLFKDMKWCLKRPIPLTYSMHDMLFLLQKDKVIYSEFVP